MTTNIENIENRKNMVQHSQFNGNVETGKEPGYHPDGCLQPTISLTDDETIVNLKGYTVSVAELKEHVIDSIMYRKHLRELMESQ